MITKIVIKIILVARPSTSRCLVTCSRQPRSIANSRTADGVLAADDDRGGAQYRIKAERL
jgi:hypothetical protein